MQSTVIACARKRGQVFGGQVFVAIGIAGLLVHGTALALPDPAPELRRQQERTQALQRQFQDKRIEAVPPASATPDAAALQRLPQGETPCFVIHRIELAEPAEPASASDGQTLRAFAWLPGVLSGPHRDDSPLHACLGAQGIGIVLKRAQYELIAKGYVTSRALVLPQDLGQGTLVLTLIPGRVQSVRFDPPLPRRSLPPISASNTLPLRGGDLLNLRAIEQGLENFKRVPTAEAEIKIAPAADSAAGDDRSDLVIAYQQSALTRFTTTLDDSGSKATGKYQGSATLSVDNPLGLSDLFYLTLSHDLGDGKKDGHGTHGNTVHYSLPHGYWTLGATASDSRYFQNIAGLSQNYVYSGTSNSTDIKLSRLVSRDAVRKTTLSLKAWQRTSNNFIDDTEVEVQRRVMGGWELGVSHKEFVGDATLEGNLNFKFGTSDFGAIAAPEEAFDEGTARFGLITLDATLALPFQLAGARLRYNGAIRVQDNTTPLLAQDRFAIGGRYTVRGFDGESSLSAERGWLLRNDLSAGLGDSGQEVYLGIDFAELSGRSSASLLGTTLSGAVVGLRGAYKRLQYEVFVGTPLHKPAGFSSADTVAGFSLSLNF